MPKQPRPQGFSHPFFKGKALGTRLHAEKQRKIEINLTDSFIFGDPVSRWLDNKTGMIYNARRVTVSFAQLVDNLC